MKTICIILLSTLMAAGCHASQENSGLQAGNPTPETVSSAKATNGLITLHLDEKSTYADLDLRWLEVMDSRCPTGVQCVWAGEVKVMLEATNTTDKDKKPIEFELTLKVRGKPATESVWGYELELLSVHPYPENKVTPQRSNYVAEVKISNTRGN